MASHQVQRLCSSLHNLIFSGKSWVPRAATATRCVSTRPQHPTLPMEAALICMQSVENSTKVATVLKCAHHATRQQTATGHPPIPGLFLQPSALPIHKYICPTTTQNNSVVILDNLNIGNKSLECPTLPIRSALEMPQIQIPGTEITEPVVNSNQKPAIEAKNIMKIRRRKMNRHQLKKFRKRMKFVLQKQRMAKEKKKEAAFQAMLADIRRDAENYDALQHIKGELEAARRGGFWIDIRQTAKKPSP